MPRLRCKICNGTPQACRHDVIPLSLDEARKRCLPSMLCRLPLTRPEMALSLLIEVAYEHDEEFRQHLPQAS